MTATQDKRISFVSGRDVRAGDVLVCIGGDRTVTGFEEHPGLTDDAGEHHAARVARSGPKWGITVFDDDCFRNDGTEAARVLYPSHLNSL